MRVNLYRPGRSFLVGMPDEFIQEPPRPPDPWADDPLLRTWLARTLPRDAFRQAERDLERFGGRVVTEATTLGAQAEANPPALRYHTASGRTVGALTTSPAWEGLAALSAEEGLVAEAYEEPGPAARLRQAAKVYMVAPVSAIYTCPVAMADGAARLIQVHGGDDAVLADAFDRLTSRDPDRAWVSGQWMTERAGGSDVARGTRTVARPDGAAWRLTGHKWFASAADAPMAIALARAEGDERLSTFYVARATDGGGSDGVHIRRLKDKLGTRALPTAEIDLHDTEGRLVGERERGIPQIATLFNVTRIHNAVNAAAYMRHAVQFAKDYAERRHAFGRRLAEHPLHAETLAEVEAECAAAFALGFRAFELQGHVEGGDDAASLLLRLVTPLAKLYTGKQAVAVVSEAMEAIGGIAYLEDGGFPRLLRDAQVLPIWEGTTNVLALDVLRALHVGGVFEAFAEDVAVHLERATADDVSDHVGSVEAALEGVRTHYDALAGWDRDAAERHARRFAYAAARTYSAALLLAHASWCVDDDVDADGVVDAAVRWARRSSDDAWSAGRLSKS